MPKLAAIEFRVFLVMVIEVARKTIVENGRKWRKWISAGKWQEMDFRVLLVVVIEVTRQAMVENG